MRNRSRIGGWILGSGLLLSVVSALPTFQWCTLAWSDVPLVCLLLDAPPCPAPAKPTYDACCLDPSSCPLVDAAACDASRASDDAAPQRRAWCFSPGMPRLAPHAPVAHEPLVFAVVPDAVPDVAPTRGLHGARIAEARPPTPPGRTPPSIRGPPSIAVSIA